MATSTLLFIGCENALCKTVDNEFNGNGYHIEHAHTGSRAMQVLELQQIDLAVLDSELPVIDCLKTLELMKQKHPKLAVILLTDDSHPQTAVEAMKHGVYDYFTKPVDWERLKTVVRNG
ncbi:MAG: response regulator [bacterium]